MLYNPIVLVHSCFLEQVNLVRGLFLALIMAVVIPAEAQQLIMTRSLNTFPETMLNLQEAIADQGYTISRVQRVDIGLTKMGYETDKYRVVFFVPIRYDPVLGGPR